MKEEKPNILYIDDEENNLISFKANFREFYNVDTALSAEDGLAYLEKRSFHCIIVDQRMPGITGIEFLESVVESYPETIRILLTGYTDIKSAINAINKGQIYKYITKPLDPQTMKMAIDNACELYQTRYLLAEKNRHLEKANQEINRFAYSVSHDIRAPLTSIMGIVDLAMREKRYQEDVYFQMIETMVKKLDHFTKNVIDYYVNGKAEKQIKQIDFQSVVNDLISEMKLFRDTEKIDFIVSIRQTEPFNTDEFRIRLILNNLISNAINFRDKRKQRTVIEIIVYQENGKVTMFIKDNGKGIDAEHLDHIFKMFYRASSDTKGSGLGLYMVKEAIERIGGEISIESTIDKGTSFKLIIPSLSIQNTGG